MSIVKVTRKRQITLPKEVCDRLGIAPGDYVKVYVDERGRIVVEKVIGIDELEGALNPGYQVEGLAESLDEERKHGER
ncbi:MAG: AbrB/MazE/SpoVT family DNA-binding domain-containing protein [Desulfurococcales archaeon]|nr:AbrB/MazE/SpoVT family DNA-binding domain-containing protein [Desulfurococcales archaeon]